MGRLQSANFMIQPIMDDLFTAIDLFTANLDRMVQNCIDLNRIDFSDTFKMARLGVNNIGKTILDTHMSGNFQKNKKDI